MNYQQYWFCTAVLLCSLPNLEELLAQEPDFVLELLRRRYDFKRADPNYRRERGQPEDEFLKDALRARGIDVSYLPKFSYDKCEPRESY
jgi:hypothetical protein